MKRNVYLDNASTPIYQERVLRCAERYTTLYRTTDRTAADCLREMNGYMSSARSQVAKLINCDVSEVALVQNTQHALGIIANCIPIKKGENILVCDLEFLASIGCWKPRICRVGAELREVKNKNGRITAEDFEEQIDSNTRAILIASVQEINGFRANIRAIAEVAHKHGCYMIVDGIQEVGAFCIDVKNMDVDFYCAGGKKWLGNPFATGFLYVKKEIAEDLVPIFYGYYNLKLPEKYNSDFVNYLEDPNRHPFDEIGFQNDASKFEIGAYGNYLGALGLSEGIQMILDIGINNIEKQIRQLGRQFVGGLEQLGLSLCRPIIEEEMSGILSFNLGFENGTNKREKCLLQFLNERNIFVSLRCSTKTGGIRVSPHYYNSKEDIDILLNEIKEFLILEA